MFLVANLLNSLFIFFIAYLIEVLKSYSEYKCKIISDSTRWRSVQVQKRKCMECIEYPTELVLHCEEER